MDLGASAEGGRERRRCEGRSGGAGETAEAVEFEIGLESIGEGGVLDPQFVTVVPGGEELFEAELLGCGHGVIVERSGPQVSPI